MEVDGGVTAEALPDGALGGTDSATVKLEATAASEKRPVNKVFAGPRSLKDMWSVSGAKSRCALPESPPLPPLPQA